METIGIISLYGRFNYGNRLQNFATLKICEHGGFAAESLVLSKKSHLRRDAKRTVKRLLGRPEPPRPEETMNPRRLEAFDRFNELIPVRHFDHIDRSLRDEYTYFIVGSDQVWNPRFFAYNDDWFFLRFAAREQRIALAPSIGVNELTRAQQFVISRGVKGFPRISVREEKGAELIRLHAGIDATVVCDPTLVISVEEWMKVADDRLTPTMPYVFTYLLGNGSVPSEIIEVVTHRGKLPVVALADREGHGELPAGPAEFLALIANASHVVTDSFHAAVFSCIFQRPLTIVRRVGGASMFSRLEQLSRMLDIEHKIYGFPSFDLVRSSDYEGVPEAIERERRKYINYFEACLIKKPSSNCFHRSIERTII